MALTPVCRWGRWCSRWVPRGCPLCRLYRLCLCRCRWIAFYDRIPCRDRRCTMSDHQIFWKEFPLELRLLNPILRFYRSTVDGFDAGDDASRDDDAVAVVHVLEEEDAEVEVVEQRRTRIPDRMLRRYRLHSVIHIKLYSINSINSQRIHSFEFPRKEHNIWNNSILFNYLIIHF